MLHILTAAARSRAHVRFTERAYVLTHASRVYRLASAGERMAAWVWIS